MCICGGEQTILRTSWGQFVQLGTKASSPIGKTLIFESVVRVRISQVVVMVRVRVRISQVVVRVRVRKLRNK